MKQGRRAQKFILHHWWTYVIWKMLNWKQSTKKNKGRVVLRGEIVKMIQTLTQYSLKKDHQHLKWQPPRYHGYYLQIAGLRWTSSWRSIGLYPRKMEDAHKLFKIPKSECPDIWIRLPRHKWPKSWSSMEDPVVFSWEESVRSSFGRTIMGKAIWENPIETWLGENSKLGMSLCTSWKRIIVICVCVDDIIGWGERVLIRCGNYSTKKSIWENQHLSLIMFSWGALIDNVI